MTTLGEKYKRAKRLDPLSEGFYVRVGADTWKKHAYDLTRKKDSRIGAVSSIGGFLFEEFLNYMGTDYERISPFWETPEYTVNNKNIYVKTRRLTPRILKNKKKLYDDSLNLETFTVMISDYDLENSHDIYICCGYNPKNRDGYVLGWTTAQTIEDIPVDEKLKYPAKCIPLKDLHPLSLF